MVLIHRNDKISPPLCVDTLIASSSLIRIVLDREMSLWRSWTPDRWRFSCAACWKSKAMGKVSDGYHSTLTDMRLNQKGFPRHIFMKHDKDMSLCQCQSAPISNSIIIKSILTAYSFLTLKAIIQDLKVSMQTFKSGSWWTVVCALLVWVLTEL